MLVAVLSAVPATNTAPVFAEQLSAADVNVFFGHDLQERRGRDLGTFAALPVSVTDIRCDLHPRWLPDGPLRDVAQVFSVPSVSLWFIPW